MLPSLRNLNTDRWNCPGETSCRDGPVVDRLSIPSPLSEKYRKLWQNLESIICIWITGRGEPDNLAAQLQHRNGVLANYILITPIFADWAARICSVSCSLVTRHRDQVVYSHRDTFNGADYGSALCRTTRMNLIMYRVQPENKTSLCAWNLAPREGCIIPHMGLSFPLFQRKLKPWNKGYILGLRLALGWDLHTADYGTRKNTAW